MAEAILHSLTQHTAMELAQKDIRVDAVSPAVVHTPIHDGFIPKDEVHRALQGFDGSSGVVTAQGVAEVIAFLLSDPAARATGADRDVDGGVMAGHN